MKITAIGTTNPNSLATKSEMEHFSGICAGVCYMPDTLDTLFNEDTEKTEKRINMTMEGGHHSVYDHNFINLSLEGIPKLLAMFINNEKMYVTSEKSARYTVMEDMEDEERIIYNKWVLTFTDYLEQRYGDVHNRAKRKKLAMENARYMISVFTPTTMIYTVSYRQLNYLYQWLDSISDLDKVSTIFAKSKDKEKWKETIKEFKRQLKATGYINENLKDYKSRSYSLFVPEEKVLYGNEIFSDVYSTCYTASFVQVAQAQRHRSLNYCIANTSNPQCYIPIVLCGEHRLEWQKDFDHLRNLGYTPQATLVNVRETGTYENFILKAKERICSAANLEIAMQTKATLDNYINNVTNPYVQNDIKKYDTDRARCSYPDFKCTAPCGWADGITLERLM